MTFSNGTSVSSSPKHGDMRDYRAPSLLQPHRARQAIRDAHEGKIPPLIGYFHMLCNPQMCKVVAQLGYDIVLIDMEHSAMNLESLANMVNDIQFISEGKSIAWVRVSGHSHEDIGYALDCGASVMIPQVHTVEEAKHVLAATKFGVKNRGNRSAPPARLLPGISDGRHDPSLTIWESLNAQAAVIIQIESAEGVRNLDDILTECGQDIDACFIGQLDLRADIGLSGPWGDEPEFLELMDLFNKTVAKHNMPRTGGAMGDPETRKMMGANNTLTFATMDVFTLVQASLADLATVKEMWSTKNHSARNHKLLANGDIKAVHGAANGIRKTVV